jgi:predicted cupin superfamily sugar epimerase
MATQISKPYFAVGSVVKESVEISAIIERLGLQEHPEGGYFVETDRDRLIIPSPFPPTKESPHATRNASTTIFYLLTPKAPQGHFHRNAGRTVHTLHWGRGRYVLIHADESCKKKRVESFIVGKDVLHGERLQWIVDGGKYKASFLMPDNDSSEQSTQGLLISEVRNPCDRYWARS